LNFAQILHSDRKLGQKTPAMNLFERQQQEFQRRHIGPDAHDTREMLETIGKASIEALISDTIPAGIRLQTPLQTPPPQNEYEYLEELKTTASKNKLF